MTEKRMASDTIMPVTPESNKPKDGNSRRNSTGKTITRGSLSPSDGEKKLLPHYLRASTSSCHDFCKYGRKHAFEEKGKHPIRPIFMGNKDLLKNFNPGERKVKPLIKLKTSPEKKTELSEKPQIVKGSNLLMKEKTVKPTMLSKPKQSVKSPSPLKPLGGLNGRRNSENCIVKNTGLSKSREKKVLKPKPSVKSPSPLKPLGGPNGRRNSENNIVKNTGLSKSREKKVLKPPTTLSPKPSVNGVASEKLRNYRNTKASSPAENQNAGRKSEPNDEMISEKTLYVIEPKLEKKTPKLEKKTLEPIQDDTFNNRSSKSTLSSPLSSSVTLSPSLSSQEEEEEEEEPVPEPEPEPETGFESMSKSESESESETTLSEVNYSGSDHSKTEEKDPVEISKGEDKRRLRRGSIINHEDKDSLPRVLKFRRGKVLSLHSENNGPRKLRFRQGRVIGENMNSKGEVGKRSFRRRKDLGGDSNGNNLESHSVVLKHQDVEGKKDAQGLLFNDVIEETANKLVEKRKSKVKALVGAFETVISLQETKTVTND